MKRSHCAFTLHYLGAYFATSLRFRFTARGRPTRPPPGGSSLGGVGRSCPRRPGSAPPGAPAPRLPGGRKPRGAPASRQDPPASPELRAHGEAAARPRAVAGLRGDDSERLRRRGRGGPELQPQRGAGALPASRPPPGSPGPPGTLREEPRAAVTRQGGNGGARRPPGEGGNASALGPAPVAPGGSTAERGCMMEFEYYLKRFYILD
ncbi:hypothetical protein VULLAG_LOCUS289 [Vulpes lagopus]